MGLGLIAACGYLSRTEFLIHLLIQTSVVIPTLLFWKRRKSVRELRMVWGPLFAVLILPLGAFVAFGLFGLYTTGHFFQSSASQKSILFNVSVVGFEAVNPIPYLKEFARHGLLPSLFLLLPIVSCPIQRWQSLAFEKWLLIATFIGVHLFYLLAIPIFQRHYTASFITLAILVMPHLLTDEHMSPLKPVLIGSLLLALFIKVFDDQMISFLVWRVEVLFAVAILLSLVLSSFKKVDKERFSRSLLIASAVSLIGLFSLGREYRYVHVWRAAFATALNETVSDDIIIGAVPTGIYAAFSNNKVINLDGAISWPALDALRQGRLIQFVQQEKIEILLETWSIPGFERVHPLVQIKNGKETLKRHVLDALKRMSDERATP